MRTSKGLWKTYTVVLVLFFAIGGVAFVDSEERAKGKIASGYTLKPFIPERDVKYVRKVSIAKARTPTGPYMSFKWLSPPLKQQFERFAKNVKFYEFDEIVKFVRDFVIKSSYLAENLQTNIEFLHFYNSPQLTFRQLMKVSTGRSLKKVPLECFSRTHQIRTLLSLFGIVSRQVYTFSSSGQDLQSHTMYEIYNPTSKKWSVYDSTDNISFKHKETGKRLSAVDLAVVPIELIQPVGTGVTDGWKGLEFKRSVIERYRAVLVDNSQQKRPNEMYIDPVKFLLTKKFIPGLNNSTLLIEQGGIIGAIPGTIFEIMQTNWERHGKVAYYLKVGGDGQSSSK